MARIRPAVNAFWNAYRESCGLSNAVLGTLLRRAVRHAGARLLVAALEQSQPQSQWTSSLENAVRLGAEVLRRPDEAGIHLLGLRPTWAQ
jgi:hypothetical protein